MEKRIYLFDEFDGETLSNDEYDAQKYNNLMLKHLKNSLLYVYFIIIDLIEISLLYCY